MSLSFCARAVQRVTRAGARAARQTLAAPAAAATRRAASSVAKAGKAKPVTLSSVLDKELEYEKENGESSVEELAAALTGAGWALHSKDGSARFHVTKSFGAQTVRVDVDVTPMPGDEEDAGEEGDEEGRGAQGGEEDEEDGPVDGYRLLVTVTEPSKPTALQFGCFVTDVLRIHRVTAFPAGAVPSADTVFGGADESPAYGGPNFDELDQAVQNAFYEYLADRGVDDAAADKLGDYAAAKENAEYTAWLAAVSAFVK